MPVGTAWATPGCKHHWFHRAQVQAGVFQRTVGVGGEMRVGMKFLDEDFHKENFAIITVS